MHASTKAEADALNNDAEDGSDGGQGKDPPNGDVGNDGAPMFQPTSQQLPYQST